MDHDISQNEDYESSAASRLSAALSCIRRGWPVVPLHDVALGYCSCGDTSTKHMDKSAGKHPLAKAWGPGALTDEEIVRGMFGGRPSMNFGIKTGTQAGIWALDVDPKNGGDVALAELVKAHGALPDTYTQRTGSGGLHHLFSLPADFTPTNSPGSLPTGLDVRGEGGFVVAAPCRSGIGTYEVLLDLPTVGAPDWLLELIRPRVPADVEHKAALSHWDNPLVASQGGNDRLRRYAYAAAMAELTELQNAPQGRRGWTAHKVACSLIELINSPWAGLGEEMAREWFSVAAQRAMAQGGAFNQTEAWAAWGSAAKKIGARGRAAPDGPAGGVLIPWGDLGGVPPFSPSSTTATTGMPGSGTMNGSMNGSGSFDIGAAQGVSVDTIGHTGQDPVSAMILTWLDGDGLAALPSPKWLIRDWIPRDALVQTVGQPGHGKSFVALDQALHLALGREWHGARVERVRVGYMVAEGAAGMGQRYKAWCQRFNGGAKVEGIWFIPYPIQAGDNASWEVLMGACLRLGLEYIVLDTQARVTVGMEENSAKEMGEFVDQVERLRRCTGATVNLVHHQTKAGGSARGSGAMLGALHTEITVSRLEGRVTSTITKQKDAEACPPLVLQLVNEKVGEQPASGWISGVAEPIFAAVLVDTDPLKAAEEALTEAQGTILAVIRDEHWRGALKSEIKASAMAKPNCKSRDTFNTAWNTLLDKKLIGRLIEDDKPTHKWIAVANRAKLEQESGISVQFDHHDPARRLDTQSGSVQ